MTVLAIDPSSTRTGYAVMADSMTILDAGLLKPNKSTDPAIKRIVAMAGSLAELLDDLRMKKLFPEVILVETPYKHNRCENKNLATYGFAAGVMFWECFRRDDVKTFDVNAEDWTGKVPKFKRQQNICMMFQHRYDPETDKGGDIADAIGLAVWWFRQQKAHRITENG